MIEKLRVQKLLGRTVYGRDSKNAKLTNFLYPVTLISDWSETMTTTTTTTGAQHN
jgi:hypothetical protein